MVQESDDAFSRLEAITARLASTANVEEITRVVSDQIALLGFGAIWIALIEESTGHLVTVRELIDGQDTGHEMPRIPIVDMRQPIGHGFRDRRMVNIHEPDGLLIIEDHPEGIPDGRMALPRVIFEHLRGHPFACGPLLGSRGQPVGALGLSSYRGREPIPDELFEHGLLRAFMNHLGIAMERALHLQRLERLNAELSSAQEMLARESRMRAVGELASAVAHDLNNYSNIALMAASLARQGSIDPLSALVRVERANRTIGDMARRLQRVARTGMDANGRTNLRQIVEDVVHLMSPLLSEGQIRLDVSSRETPLDVQGDETMVRQAVTNVLLNAREAVLESPSDRRRIEVTLGRIEQRVYLQIRDHGPGIPPEVMKDMFNAFVTSKPNHAGLGLASSFASMKHFGGQLSARNLPDGGACFDLTFVGAEPSAAEAEPSDTATPGRLRILVLDDEPDFVEIVRISLLELGHEVVGLVSADDALRAIDEQRIDLAFCDVGLPGRNGLELLPALKRRVPRVVLMTGWDTDVVKTDQRSRNADGLLQKPFERSELLRTLAAAVSQDATTPTGA
jgi:signal transduction histidine kinase/ActR/RegA family two-component response regulator